ncbi:DUF998 domain-containing protein [Reichenbachiella carrageenanivorans]|uniref:DUF998 domain-containing protein n=1 Tax=Reichenbachiella carrageenanivorans TaxID=2979869 RepID=A0ABY6CXP5_9BACT|nr:DUF998 domain-containing protein [Reichenbachiella carrageenanivorans]UXX78677.1 DUF998 domain-containing protein [Reichenbachiella carrageenanivorans]
MNSLTITKISAIGFIALLVLLHVISTSVNPIWQPISEYALGNAGWLMKIAFFSLGISFFTLGIYLIKHLPNTGSKVGGVLLIVASLGNFLAGIFNTDPVSTLPEQMTISGQIHNAAAGLLGFMILATVFIAFQFRKQEQLKPYKKNMLLLTIMLWVLEFALIIAMGIYLSETNGMLTPETPIGWLGRTVIVFCAIWVWICAKYLQKSNHKI